MKDIKQFIGTKTAIYCKTQDEWDYIISLQPNRNKIHSGDYNKEYEDGERRNTISIYDTAQFIFASKEYYTRVDYDIITATDFMREIYGWKLKAGCEKYGRAARQILENCALPDASLSVNTTLLAPSTQVNNLSEAGVLDLWFEPVYKEVKVWPKKGAPCLVWDEDEDFPYYRISQGDGTFTVVRQNDNTEYDNYLELTPENLDKLPVNK